MTQTAQRHRVVIIGSGFGGLFTAKALRRADVDVTVIDRTSHHLFQPLLYQVATGILSEGEIAPPTRDILRRQHRAEIAREIPRRVPRGQPAGRSPRISRKTRRVITVGPCLCRRDLPHRRAGAQSGTRPRRNPAFDSRRRGAPRPDRRRQLHGDGRRRHDCGRLARAISLRAIARACRTRPRRRAKRNGTGARKWLRVDTSRGTRIRIWPRPRSATRAEKRPRTRAPQRARRIARWLPAERPGTRLPAARGSFEEAIALDPSYGNAWLGRGLTSIRKGDADGGRQDLQTAATLEPNRSLFRSYLGKGWSNAGDDPLAMRELDRGMRSRSTTTYLTPRRW